MIDFLNQTLEFVTANKEALGILAVGIWNVWMASKSGSNQELLNIALRLVRDVAASSLSNVEKRQRVVDGLKDKAPAITKLFTDAQLHEIAERAYQLLKAELKV